MLSLPPACWRAGAEVAFARSAAFSRRVKLLRVVGLGASKEKASALASCPWRGNRAGALARPHFVNQPAVCLPTSRTGNLDRLSTGEQILLLLREIQGLPGNDQSSWFTARTAISRKGSRIVARISPTVGSSVKLERTMEERRDLEANWRCAIYAKLFFANCSPAGRGRWRCFYGGMLSARAFGRKNNWLRRAPHTFRVFSTPCRVHRQRNVRG